MEINCVLSPHASSFSSHSVRRLSLGGGRRAILPPKMAARREPEGCGGDYGGRLVDQNMIVLRIRMREIEMAEKEKEATPAHWPEWEKRYYCGRYGDDVYLTVAILQNLLMGARPSLAIAAASLVAVSVPVVVTAVVFNLVAVISAAIHF